MHARTADEAANRHACNAHPGKRYSFIAVCRWSIEPMSADGRAAADRQTTAAHTHPRRSSTQHATACAPDEAGADAEPEGAAEQNRRQLHMRVRSADAASVVSLVRLYEQQRVGGIVF